VNRSSNRIQTVDMPGNLLLAGADRDRTCALLNRARSNAATAIPPRKRRRQGSRSTARGAAIRDHG
jgi:hypothetical protein